MPTPERVAELIRLFAPIVLGIVLITAGLFIPNLGVMALGAGALGIPGAAATK